MSNLEILLLNLERIGFDPILRHCMKDIPTDGVYNRFISINQILPSQPSPFGLRLNSASEDISCHIPLLLYFEVYLRELNQIRLEEDIEYHMLKLEKQLDHDRVREIISANFEN